MGTISYGKDGPRQTCKVVKPAPFTRMYLDGVVRSEIPPSPFIPVRLGEEFAIITGKVEIDKEHREFIQRITGKIGELRERVMKGLGYYRKVKQVEEYETKMEIAGTLAVGGGIFGTALAISFPIVGVPLLIFAAWAGAYAYRAHKKEKMIRAEIGRTYDEVAKELMPIDGIRHTDESIARTLIDFEEFTKAIKIEEKANAPRLKEDETKNAIIIGTKIDQIGEKSIRLYERVEGNLLYGTRRKIGTETIDEIVHEADGLLKEMCGIARAESLNGEKA